MITCAYRDHRYKRARQYNFTGFQAFAGFRHGICQPGDAVGGRPQRGGACPGCDNLTVLLNDHGVFVDSEFILGVEPRRDGKFATPWFELDCDLAGREQEVLCKGRTGKGRTGKVLVWGALGSRSSVLFDLDNDGDLDIVTNDFNSPPMVLISDLAARNPDLRYLKVQLEGTRSNRNGLGATVKVSSGDRVYTKVNDGQSGYLSQSDYPLYFGLGDANDVDRVEVSWPSGTVQVVEGPIRSNQVLKIVEE